MAADQTDAQLAFRTLGAVHFFASGGADGNDGLTPSTPKPFNNTSRGIINGLVAGDVAVLGPGTWDLGTWQQITPPPGVNLFGAGPGRTIIKCAITTQPVYLAGYNWFEGFTVENSYAGAQSSGMRQALVIANTARQCVVRDCYFLSHQGIGAMIQGDDNLVEQCVAEAAEYGFYFADGERNIGRLLQAHVDNWTVCRAAAFAVGGLPVVSALDSVNLYDCMGRAERSAGTDRCTGVWAPSGRLVAYNCDFYGVGTGGNQGSGAEACDDGTGLYGDLTLIGCRCYGSTYDLNCRHASAKLTIDGATAYSQAKTNGTITHLGDLVDDLVNGVESGITRRQYRRACGAILGGLITGAGTGGEVFKSLGGSATRAQVTVDASGNRSNVVLSLT